MFTTAIPTKHTNNPLHVPVEVSQAEEVDDSDTIKVY
jgi:hypothetical protein